MATNNEDLIENVGGDPARDILKQRIRDIENSCPLHIKVPSRLASPEILVIRTKAHLETLRPSSWHGLESNIESQDGFLTVEVTKGNISRMMRFIDSFMKLLNRRGHRVHVSGRATYIIIEDERFQLKFREKCKRQKIKDVVWRTTALVPNGRLSVKLVHPYNTIEWVDNRKQIEEQLVAIVASLELRAEAEKAYRVKWQLSRNEQIRLQEIEERRKAAKVAEQARIELLVHHAGQWQVAQNLDRYITHIESLHAGEEIPMEVRYWITWAKGVQESIDPLSGGIAEFVQFYDTISGDVQKG